MASLIQPSESIHIPFPETVDLKKTKGTFHNQLKKLPLYRARGHSRVTFHGTVKVHGTNITVVFRPSHGPQIQSRNKIITPTDDDGYRSAAWIAPRIDHLRAMLKPLIPGKPNEVMIAGELTGGGINPGQAATSALDQFFVVFAVRVDGLFIDRRIWQGVRFDPTQRVFNIYEFKTFEVVIDFDEARTIGGGLKVWELSAEVENECPVALKLGGIKDGRGEGIVWLEERNQNMLPLRQLRFKSKGPQFATVGGASAVIGTDIKATADQFVKYAVTEARLEQGLETIRERACSAQATHVSSDAILSQNRFINSLSNWIEGDLKKELLEEMLKLDLASGVGKAKTKEAITRKTKEFFVSRQRE